jgi:hypothetical protein
MENRCGLMENMVSEEDGLDFFVANAVDINGVMLS